MNTYSQASQDLYVYQMVPRSNGTFIDIGCGHPSKWNNTLALEELGWTGLLVDSVAQQHIETRRAKFIQADARGLMWPVILSGFPRVIDYLSLDVDEASLDALVNVMGAGHQFRVITLEHDAWRFGDTLRAGQRELLTSLGYTLHQADVCATPDMPFEDWWYHPQHLHSFSYINDYFGHIFCINMTRRTDRWSHAVEQFRQHNLEVERFEAHDMGHMANDGCTQSHRSVMGLIVERQLPRALVLEDDFYFLYPDAQRQFANMIGEVPPDWEMLYLGGHYAERPQQRITRHVIRMGHMKTTSSYGVTQAMARKIYDHIKSHHGGAIDELYRIFHQRDRCYIFQPRLAAQYDNYSDIQGRVCDHTGCMMDTTHENMV